MATFCDVKHTYLNEYSCIYLAKGGQVKTYNMPRTDTQASARTLVFYDFMETGKLRTCMPFFFSRSTKNQYENLRWYLS